MQRAQDILDFWLNEVGEDKWYVGDDALDQKIRDRFMDDWQALRDGRFLRWLTQADTALAYILLADQFPRNMFRGQSDAFATDQLGRAAAKRSIDEGFDKQIAEPQRQFFYLPLMHSENASDQDRSVRLILTRMPETGESNLLHARAHREVIRRFCRFPYRNEALGRQSTEDEKSWIENGGYGKIVEEIRKNQA